MINTIIKEERKLIEYQIDYWAYIDEFPINPKNNDYEILGKIVMDMQNQRKKVMLLKQKFNQIDENSNR
jgi:hypothetical protein